MSFFEGLVTNVPLICAAVSWLLAQIIKTILHLIVTRKFDAERLIGTGGMPSSHSATVSSLATAIAVNYGSDSVYFAIALILAIVVMYDALGVRRETGKQAVVINEMIEMFNDMGKPMSAEEKLKIFVGHTPMQVFAGCIFGMLIAFIVCGII
ncbi:MAG: divergent PAP2 family protein [Lachnospiraceae bacterium]|nr:divergent PAP2 family protein [Lachnospiraceae bacterium]